MFDPRHGTSHKFNPPHRVLQRCCGTRLWLAAQSFRHLEPKTFNALRVIDIPEALAKILRKCFAGRNGYLFSTAQGRPLQARNVLRVLHSTGKRVGFHAFRRYRTAVLRKGQVPEDLITLWLG